MRHVNLLERVAETPTVITARVANSGSASHSPPPVDDVPSIADAQRVHKAAHHSERCKKLSQRATRSTTSRQAKNEWLLSMRVSAPTTSRLASQRSNARNRAINSKACATAQLSHCNRLTLSLRAASSPFSSFDARRDVCAAPLRHNRQPQ